MTVTLPRLRSLEPARPGVGLTLEAGAIVDLRPARPGERVEVRDGRVWITQTGDARDHVLEAGETFLPSRRGLVVVQALEPARLLLHS